MEATEKVRTAKKKLKAGATAKREVTHTVFIMSEKNRQYVDRYRKFTNSSYNTLINRALDVARSTDSFKSLEVHEPKSVAKAKAILAKWKGATPAKKSLN